MGQNVGEVYAVLGLDKSAFSNSLKGASSEFDSFGSSMTGKAGSIAKSMGAALVVGGVALAGVATVGVKAYADIESAAADAASKMDLSDIAAKTGKSFQESFESVKEHVIGLSRELGQLSTNSFDPNQIASAMANLAAGGFDVASASAKDLAPILSLATGTNYDLNDSAKLAMSTMNQYGMGIKDLGKISDVFTLASGKSAAGMKDFDYAFQQAGPIAKGVGMSFEELTARISKLADVGYSGEKAGTALRSGMVELSKATKPQMETLAKLGLTYDDVNPRVHSFGDTLDLLTSKGADIYDFADIFGKEGASIISSSASQSASVKELTKTLEGSAGASERMAGLMNDTLTGAWNTAKGSAIDLGIGIGEKLAPTLEKVFKWFSESGAPAIASFMDAIAKGDWDSIGDMIEKGFKFAISGLSNMGSSLWRKIEPAIDYVGDKFGPSMKKALTFAGGIAGAALVTKGILAIAPSALTVAGSIASMASRSLVSFGIMAEGALAAKLGFISTWAAAIGPIAGVVAGIGLIAAGLGTLGYALNPSKFKTFNTVAIDTFNGIKSVVTDCYGLIMAGDFSGVTSRLQTAFSSSVTYIKNIDWGALGSDIVSMVADGAYAIIGGALDLAGWVHDNLQEWIDNEGPQRLGRDVGDGIGKIIQSVVGSNYDYWGALVKAFGTVADWAKIATDIAVGIGQGLYDELEPYINRVHNSFITFTATAVADFSIAGVKMGDGIINGLKGAWTTISDWFSDLYSLITGIPTAKISVNGDSSSSGSSSSGGYGGWADPNTYYKNINTGTLLKGSTILPTVPQSDYSIASIWKTTETLAQKANQLNMLSELYNTGEKYAVAPTNYLNIGGVKTSSENPNGFTNTNLKNEYIKAGYTKETPGPGGVYVDKVGNVKYIPQINKETGKQETANEADKRLDQTVNAPHEETAVDNLNQKWDGFIATSSSGLSNLGNDFSTVTEKWAKVETHSETELAALRTKLIQDSITAQGGLWTPVEKVAKQVENTNVNAAKQTINTANIVNAQTKAASAYSYNSVLLGTSAWDKSTWTAADTWKAINTKVSTQTDNSGTQLTQKFAVIGSVAQSQFLAAGGSISEGSKSGSVMLVDGATKGSGVHVGGITTGSNLHIDAMKQGAGILTGALAGIVSKPQVDFTKNLAPDDSEWTTEGFEEIENSSLKSGKAIESGANKAKQSLTNGADITKAINSNSLATATNINFANEKSTVQNLYKLTGAYNYFGASVLEGGYKTQAVSTKINNENQLSATKINQATAINYDAIGIKFINVNDNAATIVKQSGENMVTHITDMDSGLCAAGDNVEESLISGSKNLGDSLATATTNLNQCSINIGVTASNIIGLANRGGGAVWGGTSVGGGGSWIGTGSTAVGGRGYVDWGGAAASNYVSSQSNGGFGSVKWGARGGLFDNGPEIIGIGEKGRELALPNNITDTLLALTDLGFAKISDNKSEDIKIASNNMARFMGRNSETVTPKELNKNMNITIIMEVDGKQMARTIMPFVFGDVKRAGMKLKH